MDKTATLFAMKFFKTHSKSLVHLFPQREPNKSVRKKHKLILTRRKIFTKIPQKKSSNCFFFS